MQNTTIRLPLMLLTLWLLLIQARCLRRDYPYYEYNSLVPVYADSLKIHAVTVESPRTLKNSAKIYYKDSTIYVIERDSGIHVIDNRVPATPRPIRFIKLMGCRDIAIKGSILYADNFTDLVSIDVSTPAQPRMVSRLSGIYPTAVDGKPALQYRGGFTDYQCIDPAKGKVVAWTYGQIDTLKCHGKL